MLQFPRFVAMLATIFATAQMTLASDKDTNQTDPDKKICKREVATGSIMQRRTCRTKAEWDAISARGQSNTDSIRGEDRSNSKVENNLDH